MVRRLNLLMTILLVGAVVQSAGSAAFADAADGHCGPRELVLGTCSTSGSSNGSGVNVIGSIDKEHNGSGPGAASGPAGRPLTDAELLALLDEVCAGDGHCGPERDAFDLNPLLPPGTPGDPTGADPATTVSITDVARFLPANATLHAEPDGWAVVRVPANFWADVSAVTVSGELLGETAQVRFTPRAYRFDYGDGTTRTSATPGASWAALGQQELTETATSHIYRERADRRATVTVVYSAEYRVAGGPWIGIAGAVSGTTPQQRVLVVVERTALTTLG